MKVLFQNALPAFNWEMFNSTNVSAITTILFYPLSNPVIEPVLTFDSNHPVAGSFSALLCPLWTLIYFFFLKWLLWLHLMPPNSSTGKSGCTHISPLSMLGWSVLAYLRVPWTEVALSPCQHPLIIFKCQERDSTSCHHTSSVEAWGDKEPMQHWAEGGEQFHCLSQGCWGANLPMQFCGFPLVPFGWDTGHQQGAGKASTYSS